jgi:hypothetical protein
MMECSAKIGLERQAKRVDAAAESAAPFRAVLQLYSNSYIGGGMRNYRGHELVPGQRLQSEWLAQLTVGVKKLPSILPAAGY